ncbi:MAG: DEAD/DEAH box helicase [Planctomycetes bacterium]|nr:DEAD/DEAH box helicase [Planctomycetota bacterium]
MRFEDLRLVEPLLRAVRTERYVHPTPIQADAIPLILAGRDVLGCAQTGTGKTAAFALPILQQLSKRSAEAKAPAGRIRVLVLCPTRELAQQIFESFRTYGRHTNVRQAVIFGGVNQNPQVRALRAGVDVLIATPGRLLDLMGQGLVSIKSTEVLVLDEADRMLDMGFLPDLRRILTDVPRKRQTLLFSATMPAPIRKLAGDILHDAVPVQVSRVSSPAPSVSHSVYHVEKVDKPGLLAHLLTQTSYTRALVFSRTKHGADKVVKKLVKAGVPAAALHGNKSQGARTRALAEFKSGKTPVLIATDIAARGLDVEDISHVINYDLTPEPETYVHRIGRTGRAGASGIAISFCTSEQHADLRAIERLIREPLQRETDPLGNGDSPPPPRPVPPRDTQPRTPRSRPTRSSSRRSRRRRPSAVSAAS